MNKSLFLNMMVSLIIFFQTPTIYAAFCSLRDPHVAISTLYNDRVNYRSVVNTIADKDRDEVKRRLSFTLHRNEIGKHTLFLIFDKDLPMGFVQARSELSEWGVMEIAWAINLDMTIRDFFYQRCRSSDCRAENIADIRHLIKGKSFSQLQAILNESEVKETVTLNDSRLRLNAISLLTIQSALKTIAITEITWQQDIKKHLLLKH